MYSANLVMKKYAKSVLDVAEKTYFEDADINSEPREINEILGPYAYSESNCGIAQSRSN